MTGKTSLLVTYTAKAFPKTEYVPTVFDNYNSIEEYNGKPINLILWDTAGQEDLANVRFLNYRDADCVICCYSVENRDSFLNLTEKWIPEISNHCANAAVVFAGLKSDLLLDKSLIDTLKQRNEKMVSTKEGDQLARKSGAAFHMQCSALKNLHVQHVIVKAMKVAIEKKKKKKVRSTTQRPVSPGKTLSASN